MTEQTIPRCLRNRKRADNSTPSSLTKRRLTKGGRVEVDSFTHDDEQNPGLQATQKLNATSFTQYASCLLAPIDGPSSPDTASHARDKNDQYPIEPVASSMPKTSDVWRTMEEVPRSACSKQTQVDSSLSPMNRPARLVKRAADRMRQRKTMEDVRNITRPIPVGNLAVESIVTTPNSSEEWKAQKEFYEEVWQKVKGTSVSTSRCQHEDLNHAGKMSKWDLHRLVEKTAARPAPDVANLQHNQLRDALKRQFDLILVPATKDFQPEYGISKLTNSWGDDQFCQGFAPQSATSSDNATREFSCPEIKRILLDGAPTDLGSNFLDLENRSGITFCSPVIDEVDLVKLIVDRGKHKPLNLARQEGLQPSYPNQDLLLKEWMIVTKGPSASYFHVDTAGQATCIFGIEGSKTWCVPRGPWDAVCSEFQAGGTVHTKWSQGIRAVSVDAGTTM
jgi:hypothetical protein